MAASMLNKRQFKSFMNQMQAEMGDVAVVADYNINKYYDQKNHKRYPRIKSWDQDSLDTVVELPSSKRAVTSDGRSRANQIQQNANTQQSINNLRYEQFLRRISQYQMQLSNEEFKRQVARLRDKNWTIKHDLTTDQALMLKHAYKSKGRMLTNKNKKFDEKPLLSAEMAYLIFKKGKDEEQRGTMYGIPEKLLETINTNSQLQNIQNEMMKAQHDRVNDEIERLIQMDPRNAQKQDQIRADLMLRMKQALASDDDEPDTLQQKVKQQSAAFAMLNQFKLKSKNVDSSDNNQKGIKDSGFRLVPSSYDQILDSPKKGEFIDQHHKLLPENQSSLHVPLSQLNYIESNHQSPQSQSKYNQKLQDNGENQDFTQMVTANEEEQSVFQASKPLVFENAFDSQPIAFPKNLQDDINKGPNNKKNGGPKSNTNLIYQDQNIYTKDLDQIRKSQLGIKKTSTIVKSNKRKQSNIVKMKTIMTEQDKSQSSLSSKLKPGTVRNEIVAVKSLNEEEWQESVSSQESLTKRLKPVCKIKRGNVPQMQEVIRKSEAYRFHGFQNYNTELKFKIGNHFVLNENGKSTQMESNMLSDLSKKLKLKEQIIKHQKQRTLKNYRHRRNVTMTDFGHKGKNQIQLNNQQNNNQNFNKFNFKSAVISEDDTFDQDNEYDDQVEKKFKQIELEQFNRRQVKSIANQRLKNYFKYQQKPDQLNSSKRNSSNQELKQNVKREIRNYVINNQILSESQLPADWTFSESSGSEQSKKRVLKNWKERSIDPRRNFRRSNKGQLNPGEIKVFDKLDRIGHYHRDSNGYLINDIEVDSLMESAYGSAQNDVWNKYCPSIRDPQASERSKEDIILCNADPAQDQSPRDPFQERSLSGTEISSDPGIDSYESQSDIDIIESKSLQRLFDKSKNWQKLKYSKNKTLYNQISTKFCNFKLVNGFKLPMPQGVTARPFKISEIIDVSGYLLKIAKKSHSKKVTSHKTVEEIMQAYQYAFNAAPLDLMRGLQVNGYLILNNYPLSQSQLRALACSIPYITRLRAVELRNINMKDEECAQILRAVNLLYRIHSIKIDQNYIGPKMAVIFNKSRKLQKQLIELSLAEMRHSEQHLNKFITSLTNFVRLKSLDLSGNIISTDCAKSLSNFIIKTQILERLNLSKCMQKNTVTKLLLNSLISNQTIQYLNISLNKFNHKEFEFESAIARLVKVQSSIVHLDISFSQISMVGLMYICSNLNENNSIQSIHLGQTMLDYYGRLFLRYILNAQVKYPFRSTLKMCDYIQNETDKNMLVILNSYILSNLPPTKGLDGEQSRINQMSSIDNNKKCDDQQLYTGLKQILLQQPITDMAAVKKVVQEFMQSENGPLKNEKDKKKVTEMAASIINDSNFQESIDMNQRKTMFTELNKSKLFRDAKQSSQAKIDEQQKNIKESLREKLVEIQQSKDGIDDKNLEIKSIVQKVKQSLIGKIEEKKKELTYKAMLQGYFNNQQQRQIQMLCFFDFYGRKQKLLKDLQHNEMPPNLIKEISQSLQNKLAKEGTNVKDLQLKTAGELAKEGYIVTEAQPTNNNLDNPQLNFNAKEVDEQIELESRIQQYMQNKRETQQLNDLKKLMQQQGVQDTALIKNFKSMFKWNQMISQINNIDVLNQEVTNPMDSHVDNCEVIFQRVLDHPEIQSNQKWHDVSECFMCNQFSKVTIEMHGMHQVNESEFIDVMHLTSIINADQLSRPESNQLLNVEIDLKDPLQLQNLRDSFSFSKCNAVSRNLMTVFEDVFEGATIDNQRTTVDNDSSQESAGENSQGIVKKINKQFDDLNSTQVNSMVAISELNYATKSPRDVQSIQEYNRQPKPKSNNYVFPSYRQFQNIIPVSKDLNLVKKMGTEAIKRNQVIFSSQINGKQIQMRNLQQSMLSPCAFVHENDGSPQRGHFNKYSERLKHNSNQFQIVGEQKIDSCGLIYNDIKLKGELAEPLDFSSSDDDLSPKEVKPIKLKFSAAQSEQGKKQVQQSQSSFRSQTQDMKTDSYDIQNDDGSHTFESQDESYNDQSEMSNLTPQQHDILLSKQNNQVVSNQIDVQLKDQLNQKFEAIQSKSGDIMKQKIKLFQIQSGSLNAKTTMPTLESMTSKQKQERNDQYQQPKTKMLIQSNATDQEQSSYKQLDSNPESQIILNSKAQSLISPTQSKYKLNINNLINSAPKANNYQDRNSAQDSMSNVIPNIHQVKKIMEQEAQNIKKDDQLKQKQQLDQVTRQFGFDKNKVPSAINSLTDMCHQNWFKLKGPGPMQFNSLYEQRKCELDMKKQDTSVFYLVASFNHWFPVIMRNYDIDQVSQFTIKLQLQKKIQRSFLRKQSQKILIQNLESQKNSQNKNLDIFTLKNLIKLDQHKKDAKMPDVPFEQKYQFTDFLPPGEHYFYFIRVISPSKVSTEVEQKNDLLTNRDQTNDDNAQGSSKAAPSQSFDLSMSNQKSPRPTTQYDRHIFCLSQFYELRQCPGSNLRMNYMNVPQNIEYELTPFQVNQQHKRELKKQKLMKRIKLE